MLAHADALVDEWARFGAQVQARLTDQLGALEHAFGEGARAAAVKVRAELAGAIEAGAGERFDRALGERLAAVRAELERTARDLRAASTAATQRDGVARRTLTAVVIGNALVVALLAVLLWRSGSAAPTAPAAPILSSTVIPVAASPDAAPDASVADAPMPDAARADAGTADAAPAHAPGHAPARRGAR
jgi:hypothetical protein